MRRPTFSVTARFALVFLLVVPAMVILTRVGADGLTSTRRLTDTLFNDIITTQHASADMVAAMDDVHTTALSALAARTANPELSRRLTAKLSNDLIPRADAALAAVQRLHESDDADELETIQGLADHWYEVRSIWNSMAADLPPAAAGAARLNAAFDDLNAVSRTLNARESKDGRTEFTASSGPYRNRRALMLFILVGAATAAVASLLWLYRGVLPRARRFSAFAGRIADGDLDEHLDVPGTDDLAVLGRALDTMATRRRGERNYDVSQLRFAESMQLTESEGEAHRMLKRHLERSITGSNVVVLNRNNSQDRLEAVTDIAPDSPLVQSLDCAAPRSCVAIRQARTYEHGAGEDALLACSVCAECPGKTTCTPFLVGGEVIGSVLLTSPGVLDGEENRRIRDSVVQSAPVLANLRNLAIAETRAATDSLTGLPNRRSIDANLMRMVAHAGRSAEPLAVLLLDLDNFKRVNDLYGHASGDAVLAGVGAALRATIRGSDFAGRYGGEEFIVALPNTSVEDAVSVAELIRRAVGEIVVPSVEQSITISAGVAVLPDHAGEVTGLVRSADRALYLAKRNGRDRVETARAGDLGIDEDHRRPASEPSST